MRAIDLIEEYKANLNNYSDEQLVYISESGVWSIGQMYVHMIEVAEEYLDFVETCARSSEEQGLGKTKFGDELFERGGFPPIKIKLPDALDKPSNSESRVTIIQGLDHVVQRLKEWETRVNNINPNHKVEHSGFGWLNAREWYDLVEMHFRHHLRQKKELEEKV